MILVVYSLFVTKLQDRFSSIDITLPLFHVVSIQSEVPDETPPGAEKKRSKVKKSKTKSKRDSKKGTGRASFGKSSKSRGMVKSKKNNTMVAVDTDQVDLEGGAIVPDPMPETQRSYKDYVISMLPREAFPDETRPNKGVHSYTLGSKCGGATIELLLKHGAYFVKKVSASGTGPRGQVSMKQHGGAYPAWEVAKQRAGFTAK